MSKGDISHCLGSNGRQNDDETFRTSVKITILCGTKMSRSHSISLVHAGICGGPREHALGLLGLGAVRLKTPVIQDGVKCGLLSVDC